MLTDAQIVGPFATNVALGTAVSTTATATIAAVTSPFPQFVYIDQLHIALFAAATSVGAALPATVTVSNMNGMQFMTKVVYPAWGDVNVIDLRPTVPLRAQTAGSDVVIVCPSNANFKWQVNAIYHSGP